MSTPIRNGLRTGTTFAVIIVFLTLIGFMVTAASLLGTVFGNMPQGTKIPPVANLVVFMTLVGLWMGTSASKSKIGQQKLSEVVVNALAAGLLSGLVTAILALILGQLNEQKIDIREYLFNVSPESIKLFMFNLSPMLGALAHLALLVISSLVGGLLAFFSRGWNLRRRLGAITTAIRENQVVAQIRRIPYAIYIVYAIFAVLAYFLPRVWGSYWNYIIGTVGIYVILGLGLNIIVGLAGQLVLGYVAFFAIGAYTVALLTAPKPHAIELNFWLAMLAGILLAALTGFLLGLPIMRLRGDYLAIVTLGFGEIIRIMLRSDLMTPITAGPKGVRDIAGPSLFGKAFTSDIDFVYLIILAVILVIFFTNRLKYSRTGRAWEAIREDEIAARATGINTVQSKLLALAIGAAFAGLAGVLFASRNQFTGPEDHSLMVSINVLALVIVGGMSSVPGIILGSFALKGLPEMLRELENYRLLFFGVLLVVMMIIRPEGLWPATRRKLENTGIEKQKEAEGAEHVSHP